MHRNCCVCHVKLLKKSHYLIIILWISLEKGVFKLESLFRVSTLLKTSSLDLLVEFIISACWFVVPVHYSMCLKIVNSLLLKCRQGLSNCLKKSLFCFCRFLCLVDLKICVSLNSTKPSLELSVEFNKYSIRSFQKVFLELNNIWIHLD